MKKYVGFILSVVLGFASVQSFAATGGSSSTEVEEKKVPISIRFLADARGTSLGRPSSFFPTPDGQDAGLTTSTNYVYFLYYTNDARTTRIGLVPRFSLQPVRGWDLSPLDPRVHVKWSNILAGDDSAFTMGLRLRTELPITTASQDKDLMFTPTVTLYPSYKVDPQWTLGFLTHIKTYFYSGPGTKALDKQYDVAFAFAPEVAYTINVKFTARLEYSLSAAHFRGDALGSFFRDGTELTLYVDWQATSALTLTPTVTVYPTGVFGFDSTTIGLELFAVLL